MKKIYFIGIALCILLAGGIISRIIIDGQNNPEHLIEVENSNAGTIITRVQTDDGLFETNVAKAGQEVYVEFILNPGYELDELHVNGADLIDGKFVMPWAGVSIQIEYTLITYHINFHTANSQRITTGSPVQYTVESNYTLPEVDEYDKTYLGWCFNEDLSDEPITTWSNMTGDYDLYPKMTDKVYNIHYELDGGVNSSLNKTQYISSDGEITLLDATKTDYLFAGWWQEKENYLYGGEFISSINSTTRKDITLHAKWICNKYDGEYRIIENEYDLYAILDINQNLDKKFKLVNDLDLDVYGINDKLTIGSSNTNVFSGVFDGNNHVVKHLKFNCTSFHSGLFGYCNGATIKNLVIEDCEAEYKDIYVADSTVCAGFLVGNAVDTDIINCHIRNSSVKLNGTLNVVYLGCLVGNGGNLDSCSVTDCKIEGSIGKKTYLGFIAGKCDNAIRCSVSCTNSSSYINLISTETSSETEVCVGGLFGLQKYYENRTISNSYFSSKSQINVTSGAQDAKIYVGGIVGLACIGVIENCYSYITSLKAVGGINSEVYVGGIAGLIDLPDGYDTSKTVTIRNCLTHFNTTVNEYVYNLYGSGGSSKKSKVGLITNKGDNAISTNNVGYSNMLAYIYNRAVVDAEDMTSNDYPTLLQTLDEVYDFANNIATDDAWIKDVNQLPIFDYSNLSW